MKCIFIIMMALVSLSAQAWDGTVSGIVSKIDVTSGNNYGFRVYLEDSPKLCSNANAWAYINESDSNYQTYVAALLAAKMSQSKVTLYTNWVNGDPDDYCKIGYVVIH